MEPNQGETAQDTAIHATNETNMGGQMDTNKGNDDADEREEGGQHFLNEFYPGVSQPTTEIDEYQ